MKEIGEKLKEAREAINITIEEAATDLKLKPSQLKSIEEGDKEAFKDIFYLKYFIRDYAKYLGLDYEDMVDEFNEFVFDYTSKISLEDIKKANDKNNKDKKKVKKISSPYTLDKEENKDIKKMLLIGLVVAIVCIIAYVIVLFVTHDDNPNDGKDINSKDITYIYK